MPCSKPRRWRSAWRGAVLAAALTVTGAANGAAPARAEFDWFDYRGEDAFFDGTLATGAYRNPILAGFYPDPSVVRVGRHFFLVNSTFSYFPGIPVFESEDLVHWRLIAHVLDAGSGIDFTGLGVSRGVFAPSIRFHDGVYYVICTAVDKGGTFLSTATNPAGPWSVPVWMPQIDGIDPSLFFDDDGRAYVLNNGEPQGEAQYPGHRAIWLQELDRPTHSPIGPRRVILNGGADFSRKPIWIEGPHLYRRGGFYYLMCAEGGTSVEHSEVVLRARSPWGPFTSYDDNPILTQRDLKSRPFPIAAAGHADLTTTPDGHWWAVFLGVRPYAADHYQTGRETFLLPINWRHGWPVILPHGAAIPRVGSLPLTTGAEVSAVPTTGNFTWRDEFDARTLRPEWLQLRTSDRHWIDLKTRPGWLGLTALPDTLTCRRTPAFLGRRQQHTRFQAALQLDVPDNPDVAAGLAVFQNESSWYFLGVQRHQTQSRIFLDRRDARGTTRIAQADVKDAATIQLKLAADAARYSFYYATGGDYRPLTENDDATFLSTDVAGGFVGVVLGPFARIATESSEATLRADPLCQPST